MTNPALQGILKMSRWQKRASVLALDIFLCAVSVACAYLIRVESVQMPSGNHWFPYVASIILAIPLFITFGLYRAIFRYVGWGALMSVTRACGIYGLLFALIFTFFGVVEVPRTIGLLQPILLFLFVGASRASARFWLGDGYRAILKLGERKRVLIYGAGSAGRQLAAALANNEEMQVVGFVDDDPLMIGNVLNATQIYAGGKLAQLIDRLDIDDVLLAIPSASRQRRNEIITELRSTRANVRTLPGIMDLAHGRVTVDDLRQLDIEDLLGREAVPPNHLLLGKNIKDKIVMVTGAGGSIGSELCRQILALGPSKLLLVEQSEFNLYAIDQELDLWCKEHGVDDVVVPLLGSVQHIARMEEIISSLVPATIYHAAAYKHVPLVESNPAEGVRNNIFGTKTVATLAEKYGVSDFVLISTDKAVRPPNVMGATKRIAEMVLQALASEGSKTRFSMVRFGNVLGSSGSVVPLFRKQIAVGGPVTVTHEDITRYFMTIPEAAQLVIQAGAMAKGGEVFVLDMGDPVKIIDLARRMIELTGLTVRDEDNPDGDIEIEVVGLRPAEKLYEELLIGDNPEITNHSRIMKARDKHLSSAALQLHLEAIQQAIPENNLDAMRVALAALVPTLLKGDGAEVEVKKSVG